jgi:hypothetical protein
VLIDSEVISARMLIAALGLHRFCSGQVLMSEQGHVCLSRWRIPIWAGL